MIQNHKEDCNKEFWIMNRNLKEDNKKRCWNMSRNMSRKKYGDNSNNQ